MTPADILRQAYAAGLEVSIAASGNLYVQPVERLTPALRALLVEHKPELLEFIHQADTLTAELLARAMAVCDQHGDSDQARTDTRADIEATPAHLRADLLAHFRQAYPREAGA
ncbi:MAG: hypothetical protein I8H71_10170 [Xanthomonadaceae bacterium]|nr:hypothetical protein [Xanthomonadaceae bacterium]